MFTTSAWFSGMKEISSCRNFTAVDRIYGIAASKKKRADSEMHYRLKTALVQVLEEKQKKKDGAAPTHFIILDLKCGLAAVSSKINMWPLNVPALTFTNQ